MVLIRENKGFQIYLDTNLWEYFVFKDRKLVIRNIFRWRDAKCYLD